jgi:hypothetical protein
MSEKKSGGAKRIEMRSMGMMAGIDRVDGFRFFLF